MSGRDDFGIKMKLRLDLGKAVFHFQTYTETSSHTTLIRMHLDRHQKVAIGLYLFTALYLFARDTPQRAIEQSFALFILLLGIIFYRQLAYFASFGLPEVFAKDYGSQNHPGPYALLFWIIFLLAWGFIFFQ